MAPEINLQQVLGIMTNFGVLGLVLFIWWYDLKQLRSQADDHKKEITKILDCYKSDMTEIRQMYQNNVALVKRTIEISEDLKDVVILNTQAWQKASDNIENNQYCPRVRLDKAARGPQVVEA